MDSRGQSLLARFCFRALQKLQPGSRRKATASLQKMTPCVNRRILTPWQMGRTKGHQSCTPFFPFNSAPHLRVFMRGLSLRQSLASQGLFTLYQIRTLAWGLAMLSGCPGWAAHPKKPSSIKAGLIPWAHEKLPDLASGTNWPLCTEVHGTEWGLCFPYHLSTPTEHVGESGWLPT
jgi:hypothetical protein